MPARLLREPLLHFLAIGAVLFWASGHIKPSEPDTKSSMTIQLTLDQLQAMVTYFGGQWHRPPTAEELQRMVEDAVQVEVLYREALTLGLDKNDTIVKRRLAQKMQFLAEDVAAAREPSRADLEAWFHSNADTFALPGRVSFRHLYFSPDRRGANTRADAADALARLAGHPESAGVEMVVADRFMLQDFYGDVTWGQLGRDFGPQFAKAVFALKPGAWQGPIESGYGQHLVFVETVIPGGIPRFEEVEGDVSSAWRADQKERAFRKAYDDMRSKYSVLLPAPAGEPQR